MEQLTRRIRAALHRLWRQEDGTLTLEFLIFAPIMFWTFLATLAFFDAYRTESINEKAAMTIADVISREPDYVTDTYIDGIYKMLKFLTLHDAKPRMRITVLRFHDKASTTRDDGTDHFHLVWSEMRKTDGVGSEVALTDADIKKPTAKLPRMTDGERLILVETFMTYNSAYNLGLRTIWGGGPTLISNGSGGTVQGSGKEVPEMRNIAMSTYIFTAPRLGQTCFKRAADPLTARKC